MHDEIDLATTRSRLSGNVCNKYCLVSPIMSSNRRDLDSGKQSLKGKILYIDDYHILVTITNPVTKTKRVHYGR